MNTSALIFMISTETIIAGLAVFFFIKVLTIKPKSEPDSYSENDDVIR
ncbi:MAG: hypothetical protein ABIJ97_13950 [Bacteroidota bacterium]